METIASTLLEVPIEDILVTDNNPRRTFEEKALEDLTASIRLKGVLQPILLRPALGAESDGITALYELVCGERRLRAAKKAELPSIPAIIRDLTDDEAFEAMIIENLERKDVHPIEEAEGFQKMIDSGRYTIEDVAGKVARSVVYVTQRLQLGSLLPQIKKDFFENKLNISQAILLARVGEETQETIVEETKNGWHGFYYGTARELSNRLERHNVDLSKAPFKTTDNTLLKGVKGCHRCPKRSGANPSLFADIDNENICFDVGCYNRKLSAHLENLLNQIASGEKDYLVGKSYSSVPDKLQDFCSNLKIPILREFEDFSTSHAKGGKSLLMISGYELGKVITVKLKPKGIEKAATEDEGALLQIGKIEGRATRALELDNEKIEAAIRDVFKENGSLVEIEEAKSRKEALLNESPLNLVAGPSGMENLERATILMALSDLAHYSFRSPLSKMLGVPDYDYKGRKVWDKLLKQATPEFFNKALRLFAFNQLQHNQVQDRRQYGNSEAFYQWVKYYLPDEVNGIQANQDEVAKKRIQRTKARISKLKEDLPKKPATKNKKKAKA